MQTNMPLYNRGWRDRGRPTKRWQHVDARTGQTT